MAEPPRPGSSPNPGQRTNSPDGGTSDEGAERMDMPPLKRRTTQMGLAPAPHLGLAGSPGARARAEAEARKNRVNARLSSHPPGAPAPPAAPMPPAAQKTL